MKKKLFFLTIACLFIILAACSDKDEKAKNTSSDSEKETITLKLGHVSAPGETHMDVAANFFKEEVEKNSNGQIKVDIFPSAQLGGERDMLESLENGTVEMSIITTLTFDSITPVFNGLSLPFLFENNEQFQAVLQGETMKKGIDSLSDLNIKGLGIFSGGIRHFGTTDKPIKSLDDLKGLKMRAAENQMISDSYQALGTIPVTVPYADMFSAVQTGVVDGLSFDLHTWYSEGFYEMVNHISLVYDMPIAALIVINLDLYNSLSDENKNIIDDAAKKMEEFMAKKLEEFESNAIDKLKEKNIQIHDGIDIAPFQEKMEPVYKKYGEKEPMIQAIIDEVNALKQK